MQIVKGIVHPKMKVLSSFTHPEVVPNMHEFLYSAKHKIKYFGSVCNQVWGVNTMEVNGYCQPWLPTFFKIYYFALSRRKKLIKVWNKWMVSMTDDRIFLLHHSLVCLC